MTRRFERMTGLGAFAALRAAALATAVLGATSAVGLAQTDEPTHDQIVDISKVDVVSEKGKPPSLELTFSLHPQTPVGAKIEFELRYQFLTFDVALYELKSQNRKNLKLEWKPKKRLVVDTYDLVTRLPLIHQTDKIKRELEAREKVFPKAMEPWTWYYPKLPVKVGTPEDQAAEEALIKDYFKDQIGKLLTFNTKFLDEMELVTQKDEKYVKAGVLNKEALKEFIDVWMKDFGKLQLALVEYERDEPGLYAKQAAAHFHLQRLSRMVAKRCYREALKNALDPFQLTVVDLKLTGATGFNDVEKGRVSPQALNRTYETINRLVKFAPVAGEGEGGTGDSGEQ